MAALGRVFALCLAAVASAAVVEARELEPCVCVNDTMDCSFRERSHFQSSEVCGGVTKANIRGNRLRAVPEGLRDVLEVDMSRNRLRELPNAEKLNPSLRLLDVSSNEIEDGVEDLMSLSALEVLNVRENRLTGLGFLPKPCSLKRLDASLNAISNLDGPLQFCSKLEMLVLTNNNLITLPEKLFVQLSELDVLDLRSNHIMDLTPAMFEGLSKLKYLRLNNNQIKTLPAKVFAHMPNLADLDLSENPLHNVAPTALDKLEQLDCLNIAVVLQTALPPNLFTSTVKLHKLTLDLNNLTTLPRELFRPLRLLEKLDILGSQLNEVPDGLLEGLGQLKTLNLYGSQLQRVPDGFFTGLHNLGVLDMRANRLLELPELQDCCDRLWYADFSENNVTHPSEAALRGLLRTDITVHLRENPLRPAGLRWAVLAGDLQHFVDEGDCACGGLRRDTATVDFCVESPCGSGADFQDWVSAVRAAGDVTLEL